MSILNTLVSCTADALNNAKKHFSGWSDYNNKVSHSQGMALISHGCRAFEWLSLTNWPSLDGWRTASTSNIAINKMWLVATMARDATRLVSHYWRPSHSEIEEFSGLTRDEREMMPLTEFAGNCFYYGAMTAKYLSIVALLLNKPNRVAALVATLYVGESIVTPVFDYVRPGHHNPSYKYYSSGDMRTSLEPFDTQFSILKERNEFAKNVKAILPTFKKAKELLSAQEIIQVQSEISALKEKNETMDNVIKILRETLDTADHIESKSEEEYVTLSDDPPNSADTESSFSSRKKRREPGPMESDL